ncbi:MAG: nickel pincer cofactor biosynthesis protein LarB [Actinomycetes bacterium]
MDRTEVRELLQRVAAGGLEVDDAVDKLAAGPLTPAGYADLGFARLDTHRGLRTGDPEVVYAAGKTPDQVVTLLRTLHEAPGRRPAMATRLAESAMAAVRAAFPNAKIDEVARCAALGAPPEPVGTVCVVSAGTSDLPVAAEAAFVAGAFGSGVERVDDVGVAGIHRLLAVRSMLDSADCLIVVAGMEGALPSVVGGLTGVPLVAVPTSVGYGASYQGLAALLAMLNSCAPGIVVCNIDNGFGAGVFAARVARRVGSKAGAKAAKAAKARAGSG